ncbi:MAG: hypothetical protein JF593_14010 [Novosphingobium sp.]|nr:hypothetical protein [Novosphingobium sp.]
MLSGRALGRTIAAVMVLILIGYTAIIVSRVRTVAKAYGSVTIGMDQRQVRYVLGQPSAGDGGPLWKYDDNGMRLQLRFAPDGRLASVSCFQDEGAVEPCPGMLGVGVGSAEGDVLARLGRPDGERYEGDAKQMIYLGLGVVFRLRQGQVVLISHVRPAGGLPQWRQVAWLMLS